MPEAANAIPPSVRLAAAAAAILLLGACVDTPAVTAPADGPDFSRTGADVDVIVVLKGDLAPGGRDVNRSRAAEVARGLGLEAGHTYGAALFGFAATVSAGRLEALRRDPRVAYVDEDLPVSLPPQPPSLTGLLGVTDAAVQSVGGASSTQVTPWGVSRIGAAEATTRGRGVSVYILDTGIDASHPDLAANLGEGYSAFACKGNPSKCAGWADDHGHGTHVAGTVGAVDNGFGVVGVAPEVTLHAVKVLGSGGGSGSDVVAGIDWVVSHNGRGVKIANMSLGGHGTKVGECTDAGLVGGTSAMYQAICNARNAGVILVVSAGNDGIDARYRVPAAYHDAVITVSAAACADVVVDGNVQTCAPGAATFPSFSNWGTGHDGAWPSRGTLPVALAAPGAQVLSTTRGGGVAYMSGTSMAAPHVAGVAALLAAAHPQQADGSAFAGIRSLLMGAAECTGTWHNATGHPHDEHFLNARGTEYRECEEPGLAPPGNVSATVLSDSEIRLDWTYGSADDVRFQLWRSDGIAAVILPPTEPGATSHADTGLYPATTYRYAVRTVQGDRTSPWSATVMARTLPAGEDPTPVAGLTVNCGNSDTCVMTDTSTGAITYRYWEFGNGQTWEGNMAFTTHVLFQTPGVFHASLRVIGQNGEESTASSAITCATQGKRLRCAVS